MTSNSSEKVLPLQTFGIAGKDLKEIPVPSSWTLKTAGIELPFIVTSTSQSSFEIYCKTDGPDPLCFIVSGKYWFTYRDAGQIIERAP